MFSPADILSIMKVSKYRYSETSEQRTRWGQLFCPEEVVCSSVVQNVLTIWENEHFGPLSVSFVERLFPLLGGPSQVPLYMYNSIHYKNINTCIQVFIKSTIH